MDSLLAFVIDKRPKVRKAAQHAICAILASHSTDHDFHPVAGHTSKVLMSKMEEQSDVKETLHLLMLFKEILPMLPKQHVKSSCESILQAMTTRDRFTLSCGFQALYGLFVGKHYHLTISNLLMCDTDVMMFNFDINIIFTQSF